MLGRKFFSVATALAASCALAGPAAAATTTVVFTTPGCTTWPVPAGVSSVQVQAIGSTGFSGGGGAPGLGDGVSGTLSGLAGGQLLDICVDQGGGASVHSGGTGGGASGVSLGSDFSSPMLVAGGGGGGGAFGGGGGGGNAGMPIAGKGADSFSPGGGGGDNTTAQGGAGGVNAFNFTCNGQNGGASSAAGPAVGGSGGGGDCGDGGGSGGGGYFAGGGGGGSGAGAGGGGGGSDFCAAAIADCSVTSGAGSSTDSAQVTITYALPVPTSIADCQHDGWKAFGSMFKNQGACVSFVARGDG